MPDAWSTYAKGNVDRGAMTETLTEQYRSASSP
jgi:hypothetical protein